MMQRLLLQSRRRKVLRVAGAYTVAGWIMLQAAEVLTPALSLPQWTVSLVAVLLLMGLPVTLAVAWVFQAPDGPAASGAEADVPRPPRRPWLDVSLLTGVVLVLVVSGLQLAGGGAIPAGPTAAGPTVSVAVLPFTSFSDDVDDNYFADGLTEELINSLAQLPGLQVPGRTSSFYFKNRNEDLRDIGRQLGVAHVLEGSVRKNGERLRVTVQLVSAADGFHLWSRTYDRQLTDVFAIQNDIADQVASVLELTLLAGEADSDSGSSAGTESYPSFLVATALLRERSPDALTEARRLFEEIIEREPGHVEALAGYARATIVLAGAYLAIDFEPAAASALKSVERALAIDADSVAANLAAGSVYDVLAFRTDEQHYLILAERALARAVDLAPNDPEVLRTYGGLLARLGRWDTALAVVERAAARDPLDRSIRFQLAEALRGLGRLGDARAELEALLARQPDYVAAHLELGELLVEAGGFEAALVHLRRAHQARTTPRATFALAHLYLNLGLPEAVRRTLEELDYAPLSAPLADMVLQVMSGDDAAALASARQELARTNDRIWRPLVVLLALSTGDLENAREELRRLDPAVLAPEPDVNRVAPATVLLAANLLMRDGHESQGRSLLEALLARLAPPAEGFDPLAGKILRAHALAQLGRADDAMAELSAARLQGYRTLFDFDYFRRLDRYPTFAGMRDDPRFQALLTAIEADNRALAARVST